MKVQVRKEHIEAGKRNDPTACPVANALTEVLVGAQNLFVGEEDIHCNYDWTEEYDIFPLTRVLKWRISHYDRTGKMNPFEFDLPTK